MQGRLLHAFIGVLALMLVSCSSSRVSIPETLESQIDQTLTFPEVMASPDSYRGRLMIVGGQVLKAKRLHEGTQVELLQLPVNRSHEPTTDLSQSQGRVLALHQEFLDPAALAPGTMVTFVGEVSGSVTGKLDELDYRYPMLTVKQWHVWPPASLDEWRGGPFFGVFGGVGVGGGTRGGGGFGFGF